MSFSINIDKRPVVDHPYHTQISEILQIVEDVLHKQTQKCDSQFIASIILWLQTNIEIQVVKYILRTYNPMLEDATSML